MIKKELMVKVEDREELIDCVEITLREDFNHKNDVLSWLKVFANPLDKNCYFVDYEEEGVLISGSTISVPLNYEKAKKNPLRFLLDSYLKVISSKFKYVLYFFVIVAFSGILEAISTSFIDYRLRWILIISFFFIVFSSLYFVNKKLKKFKNKLDKSDYMPLKSLVYIKELNDENEIISKTFLEIRTQNLNKLMRAIELNQFKFI